MMKTEIAFNSTLEAIGKKLTELRVNKGYTSHADFAFDHDLPRIQYWRLEKGNANMTLRSLHKIVTIHGLTIEQLFIEIVKDKAKAKERLPLVIRKKS